MNDLYLRYKRKKHRGSPALSAGTLSMVSVTHGQHSPEADDPPPT